MKLLNILKNRKGSVTVFLLIFFVTLVFMILIFVQYTKKEAVKSSVLSLSNLWIQSIMGEYDKHLMDDYNIYGFWGTQNSIINKVDFYAKYTFDEKDYLDYQCSKVWLQPYSLRNENIFHKQIIDVGKLIVAKKVAPKKKKEKEINKKDGQEKGIIKNKAVLNNLPSKGNDSFLNDVGIIENIVYAKDLKELVKVGTDNYLTNEYIKAYFKNLSDGKSLGDTFFQYEEEYILCGKKSDEENAQGIKWRIVALREAMNMIFLNSDKEKKSEIEALAAFLTPGPEAKVTEQLLAAAWAFAESLNDYELLKNGKRVPLVKKVENWALDLSAVTANWTDGYVDKGLEEGETYENYLMYFMAALNDEVKVLRIMDLVQINMSYLYYDDFLLGEYYTGMDLSIKVNGREYDISKSYYEQD